MTRNVSLSDTTLHNTVIASSYWYWNCTIAALFYAAELGHDVLVQELISKGAEVDVVSSKGTTPLFSACQAGYTRTVGVLVAAGASVRPTDDSGINPLMIASMRYVGELTSCLATASLIYHRY